MQIGFLFNISLEEAGIENKTHRMNGWVDRDTLFYQKLCKKWIHPYKRIMSWRRKEMNNKSKSHTTLR